MSDLASLLFYLGAFLSATLFFYLGRRYSIKSFIVISLAIPIIVGGLRFNVGTDYASYQRLFESFLNTSVWDYFSENAFNIEPGFFALIKFCHLITDQPYLLFLTSSFLTVIFFYFGLLNIDVKHKSLIYLLFLTVVFPITFNATRQGIAVSIVFFAITFLIKGKNKLFFIMTILAAAFHLSALVALLAYPAFKLLKPENSTQLPNRFLIKSVTIFGIIICLMPFIFGLITQISIFQKYANYANYVSGVSATMIAFKIATVLVVTYFFKKLCLKNTDTGKFYILMLMEISTIALWFSSAAIFRVSLFFTSFSLVLLSEIPSLFKSRFDKMIVQSSIVIFCVVYFYIAYYVAGQAQIMPYQFINSGV